MNDPRGSIWRKWDLHIHTPASYEWKGGPCYRSIREPDRVTRRNLTRQVIDSINSTDVDVFGIMDYWTFDGYLEIRKLLREIPEIVCNKTILPGIELRIEAPTNYRMNIHVLLSDQLSDQQIRDFKSKLKIRTTKRDLSEEAIVDAARRLVPSKAREHGHNDPSTLSEEELYILGCKTIEITRESFNAALAEVPNEAYIIILPYDSYGGVEKLDWKMHPYADSDFMSLAHVFETRKRANIDLFLGVRTPGNSHFIDDFIKNMGGKPKPVVSGSDAHRTSDYGSYPAGNITWIKADPTFEGLMQVLVEPRSRCFIGEVPADIMRVRGNKTKYLRSLRIEKVTSSNSPDEEWFNNEIEFNHGLVAVIGNKGNGKSALVDIIALLCEYHRKDFFSFLGETKFRNPKSNKARDFVGHITWENDVSVTRSLDDIATSDGGKIRYIPQQFFERICNETEIRRESEFDSEMKTVIFSHVQSQDRLGFGSLSEIIHYRTKEINETISDLRAQLGSINDEIANIEDQLTPGNRAALEHQLSAKEMELEAHEKSVPTVIEPPVSDSERANEITTLRSQASTLSGERLKLEEQVEEIKKGLALIDKTLNAVDLFRQQYERFRNDVTDNLVSLEINIADLVNVSINEYVLTSRSKDLNATLRDVEARVSERSDKINDITQRIHAIQDGMETAEKDYQKYLTATEEWEATKNEIIGGPDKVGSMQYYQRKIEELTSLLPHQLDQKNKERMAVVREIYRQISKTGDVYRELYSPVQHFIDTHPLIKDKYKLSFEVSVTLGPDFIAKFLQKIRQNVLGMFRGKVEGEQYLREILARYDFNSENETISFVNEILFALQGNEDIDKKGQVLRQQLKHTTVSEFYDFLFGLSYLEPDYALTLDSKKLPQLSPGERGILLLIFYLLVDGHDYPLVIDQPEENLDNQSIYELLVPCVQEAKQRRQIILVTHNANLAVVCDADQVIHAYIDKGCGNRVRYTSGAIENPEINGLLVDILEGTWPAFTKRHSMYQERSNDYRRR